MHSHTINSCTVTNCVAYSNGFVVYASTGVLYGNDGMFILCSLMFVNISHNMNFVQETLHLRDSGGDWVWPELWCHVLP